MYLSSSSTKYFPHWASEIPFFAPPSRLRKETHCDPCRKLVSCRAPSVTQYRNIYLLGTQRPTARIQRRFLWAGLDKAHPEPYRFRKKVLVLAVFPSANRSASERRHRFFAVFDSFHTLHRPRNAATGTSSLLPKQKKLKQISSRDRRKLPWAAQPLCSLRLVRKIFLSSAGLFASGTTGSRDYFSASTSTITGMSNI